jgi:gluconate 2-dehydrogenase gamma chain
MNRPVKHNGGTGLSRRQFVQMATVGTGSVILLPCCSRNHSFWRYFTASEASLMDALADQIIPPDDWPGGKSAGVTNYIDKQLMGPYRRFQTEYRKGLSAIHTTCGRLYSKTFEELGWADQTAFLSTMEEGGMKGPEWADGFDLRFFDLFRDHCMQGYYGSQRHGGNKNNVSYRMLHLDYPLIVGQNRYKTDIGK